MAQQRLLLPRGGRDYPRTLPEFEQFFPDEKACYQYLLRVRWPNDWRCPRCSSHRQPWTTQRQLLLCPQCRAHVSVTAGTIFHRSQLPLRRWFQVIWAVVSAKHGTTALDIQRTFGLGSYYTAWVMLHKLRSAMVRPDRDQLAGTVEVDEIYIGSEEHGRRGGWSTLKKAIVVIAIEMKPHRLGRVRLQHVTGLSAEQLVPFVRAVITPGSKVHTDGLRGYASLDRHGFQHRVTVAWSSADPSHVTMPGVNRVAALLKRWLLGVEQGGMAPEHLQAYLEEFTFRFNRRSSKARGLLFRRLLEQAVRTPPIPAQDIIKYTGRGRRRRLS